MLNPYQVVTELENRLAEWCGSPYCVAVESGTAAIFLCLQWVKVNHGINDVIIPKYTYPSVPCSIIHAGGKVRFREESWEGEYQLYPYEIWDAALRFKKGMYHGGFQCLSGHIKKNFAIGRGGFILHDNEEADEWLRKARFDGRSPVPLLEDNLTQLGWNMYLSPPDAARAIQLFEVIKQKYPEGMPDLKVEEQGYPNLDLWSIYKQ